MRNHHNDTRSVSPVRLSVAALGAGLLVTGMAAGGAAAAEPLDLTPAPWSAEHGISSGYFLQGSKTPESLQFETYFDIPADQVRVTVAPYSEEEGRGEEKDVEVSFDEAADWGRLGVQEARAELGEAGKGDVIFSLYVLDHDVATARFGPDADLTDHTNDPAVRFANAQDMPFDGMPEAWDSVAYTTPSGASHYYAGIWFRGDSTKVVSGPEHGRLVDAQGGEPQGEGEVVYVSDPDYSGTDTVVLEHTGTLMDGTQVTKTETVEVRVRDSEVKHFIADGLRFYPGAVQADLEHLDSILAPDAGDDESDDDGEHSVPDTVETGSGTAWWLAGLGAVAAGVLVRFRRTFGLA
ncbi:hypothetical protein [Micrococcus luteus]|uniref:hypothetical protein n=1 Tax=Micrococcus luteus TaxID=1270 RepID=UPI0015D708C5|nr:hypothetical protein [Micrococcus luteus]